MTKISFQIPLPLEVQFALSNLRQHHVEAYIVGGAIRDALMKREPHDFDISASSTPNQTMRLFPGYVIDRAGLKHGTVRVIIHKNPVEITTFRTESGYVDYRHPTNVTFVSSPEIDSSRRDFTINAFYYYDGVIYDFHDGLSDLKNKIIRAIGNPIQRFEEDALRILRALRFSAEFDFTIEEKTKEAMALCANELFKISEERIEHEILRMAAYPSFFNSIRNNGSVFDVLFAGIKAHLPSFDVPCSSSPYINLALMLDVLGLTEEKATTLLRNLKFSNSNLNAIIRLLSINKNISIEELTDAKNLLKFLLDTDPLNPELAIEYIKYRDFILKRDPSNYEKVLTLYRSEPVHSTPTNIHELMVTGNDLKRLGFKQGPEFKNILQELLVQVNSLQLGKDRKSQLIWLKEKKIQTDKK